MLSINFNPTEIRAGQNTKFEIEILENGNPVNINDQHYYIFNWLGRLIDSGIPTIVSPEGNKMEINISEAFFPLPTEDNYIQLNYQVEGELYSSEKMFFFDAVKYLFVCDVYDSDLSPYYPELSNFLWEGKVDFQDQIDAAYEEVKRDVKSKGNRSKMIIDNSKIRILIIKKSLQLIFAGFQRSGEGWKDQVEAASIEYEAALKKIDFKYDMDNDGRHEKTTRSWNLTVLR